MILPISIDLRDLVEEFSLTESQIEFLGSSIIDRVIVEYSTRWEDLVNRELKKSRSEYKRAMFMERPSNMEVIFGLMARESPLAIMVEEGVSPFDEKIGFKNSDKTKQKKDGGWYLTIPFRHATPEAVAESGIFASIMTKDIYKVAKQSTRPLKITDLPEKHRLPGIRKEINTPNLVVPEYIHKTPQYKGLVKINIQSSDKEVRSGYFTFRRVSDKSDPNSWWNTGIVPRKLMDRALEQADISKVAQMAIDNFLEKI